MTTIQPSTPYQWGLQRNITPRFGARLIQRGSRLDFLWDRSGFVGSFPHDLGLQLNDAFPEIIKKLENQVSLGHLDAHQQRCVTLQHASFTCEADTLGSHGYLYITIYPTKAKH